MSVLAEAVEKLQAFCLHCTIKPLSLPQSMCLGMHVGESQQAALAAYVAEGRGCEQAHAKGSAESFAAEVADVLAEEVISPTHPVPHELV